jgi:acylphosphatase
LAKQKKKKVDSQAEPAGVERLKEEPVLATPIADGSNERRRLHAFFSGMVQGVGFRYTASSEAGRLGITGWVRNREDGRVELLAEGTASELENYLSALGDEMSGYIRKVDRSWEPATGEWDKFWIEPSY